MKTALTALLLIFLSLSVKSQNTKEVKATVISIIKNKGSKIEFKALSGTDTLNIKWGFKGMGKIKHINPGTSFTIVSKWNKKYQDWEPIRLVVEK